MSKQTTYDKVGILGVDIDVLSTGEALDYICEHAADHKQPASYVIKPYVEFLTAAARKPALQDLLGNAELAVADGVAVQWAAHYLYAGARTGWRFWLTLSQIIIAPTKLTWPIPNRAAGTNFTWPLLKSAAQHHLRVYLIGKSSAAEIELVAATIVREVPELTIAGTACGRDPESTYGHVSPQWLEQTVTRIHDARADLILVGMGFPLQEEVCAHLAARLTHGVFIGEGGTFDYESFGGNRRKAPQHVQRLGLEWLWRLVGEPKRLRRQFAVPYYLYLIWRSRR